MLREILALIVLGCAPSTVQTNALPVQDEIAHITFAHAGTTRSTGAIEHDLLALMRRRTVPSDRGAVAVALVHLYAQGRRVVDARVNKYAVEALKYPLRDTQLCEIYLAWGDAQIQQHGIPIDSTNATARLEIVAPYLSAWRILADSLKVSDWVPLPAVHGYEIKPDDPRYGMIMKQRDAEITARAEAVRQNKLLELRLGLAQATREVYQAAGAREFRKDLSVAGATEVQIRKILAMYTQALR